MKQGKTLNELAVAIEHQAKTKKDYIADTRQVIVSDKDTMWIKGVGQLGILPICHEQIGLQTDIPKRYYDRMRESNSDLFATNVNHWLHAEPKKRMIRTLDKSARAFLSDRYRPLDNYDLAEAVLPIIKNERWAVKSCDLTDKKLYLKIVAESITGKVKPKQESGRGRLSHVVHPGIVISNSEVGLGAVRITPSVHWEHCLNLAMMDEAGTARTHIGRKDERFGDIATEFFQDATRKADDKAFWMKVRDIVKATITKDIFEKMVERMQEATTKVIDGDPVKVVEVTGKRFCLSEDESKGVLQHLIKGADLSAYGLSNAITRASQDVESYDRATELERIGGQIIELPDNQWASIASVN